MSKWLGLVKPAEDGIKGAMDKKESWEFYMQGMGDPGTLGLKRCWLSAPS